MSIFSIKNISATGLDLQVGDIVLYKNGSGILSKMVQFFTRSKYNHVAMMISDTLVIEANWYKRSSATSFIYDKEKMEIYRYNGGLTGDQKLMLLQHSYEFLNKIYDYPQILGYVVAFLRNSNVGFFNSQNKLICSELIDRAYLKIGIDLSSKKYIGDVTPKDIADSGCLEKIM